ncbi:MAG: hypothetical protein ACRCTD_08730 [Beijerinckiaceae bacterium]
MANDTYAHTPKPFGREVTFTRAGRELIVSDERKTLNAPLKEVTQVRLTYEPRNTMAKGFRMKLTLSNKRTATMTNLAWKSLVQVDKQNEPYRSFVTALIRDIGAANPNCLFIGGRPRVMWLAMAIVAAATMSGLLFLIARAYWAGSNSMALFVLAFAMYFGWMASDLLMRNRPRIFTPEAIPPDLLP